MSEQVVDDLIKQINSMKIPGLIASKNTKLTEAEIQGQREEFARQEQFNSLPDSYTHKDYMTLDEIQRRFPYATKEMEALSKQQGVVGLWEQMWDKPNALLPQGLTSDGTGNADWISQPYIGDILPQKLGPYYDPYDKAKYFPKQQPYKQPGIIDTQDLAKYMGLDTKPKKSAFEEILDNLFDTAEKEQFLISVGYEIYHEDGKDWIKRVSHDGYETKGERAASIDILFLREISIKFKNLLLAKASLKLKL